MSHFSVLVFTQDNSNADFDTVDGLLEPFSEENTIEYDGEQEVKEYFENKKAELEKAIAMPLISFDEFVAIRAEMGKGNDTEEEKADNVRVYAEIKAKKAQRKDWLESNRKDFADFDAYRKRMYNDNIEKHDGRIVLNCNPNAKWDWYSEDGRWGSILPLKSGEMSAGCLVSKVDWDKFKANCVNEAENRFSQIFDWAYFFIEEPLHKAEWIATHSHGTFAILSRDGWKARAECGWFGMSHSERPFDYWAEIERLKSIPNSWVTVVDCHL